ncbi:MAG: (d)CMP kinase [Alphaproteobacteria bacterium]|nr:(d)CMP kinase [Alphaproteobacteria bacterium]
MPINILTDQKSKIKISVDGGAATGKGSLCKKLSEEFNLYHSCSGLYYRKLALIYLSQKEDIDLTISYANANPSIFDEITENQIQSEEIARISSKISTNSLVRESVRGHLKQILKTYDRIVMEGRDIGSVVAPNADVKIFLTASIDARAKRRLAQERLKNPDITLDKIKTIMQERDERDRMREVDPLTPALDAIILDNSEEGFNEFYRIFLRAIEDKFVAR